MVDHLWSFKPFQGNINYSSFKCTITRTIINDVYIFRRDENTIIYIIVFIHELVILNWYLLLYLPINLRIMRTLVCIYDDTDQKFSKNMISYWSVVILSLQNIYLLQEKQKYETKFIFTFL